MFIPGYPYNTAYAKAEISMKVPSFQVTSAFLGDDLELSAWQAPELMKGPSVLLKGPRRLMGPGYRQPLSARQGPSERLAGPFERMKGPEAPSDEKELPKGPP